jgi:hypothetical protein
MLVAGSGATPQRGSPPWSPRIVPLTSPAAADSGQPQLSVSDRGVLLSWIERSGARATLKFAERGGQGWSAPRTVASGTNWFVNWADVPSVIRLGSGTLAAHWLQKSGEGTYSYDVRLAFSRDDGKTWSASVTPHHDGTKTEHGFASLFQMPDAGLGLVWLDGRAMKDADAHGGQGGGEMSVRFASFGEDGQQRSEMPVDLRVCECCPTTAALTADGVIAAFRDRSTDEIRDIYVSRLDKGKWTEPSPVHNDGWHIPACPVNGPVLAARGREVAIAWFTASGDQGQAYVAFSSDAGRSFSKPIRLDDGGSIGRVDVEWLEDGSAVASWIESAGDRTEFRIRRVERAGATSAAITIAGIDGGRMSGYPRMARHADTLVFAWTARDVAARVQTAFAQIPVNSSANQPRPRAAYRRAR